MTSFRTFFATLIGSVSAIAALIIFDANPSKSQVNPPPCTPSTDLKQPNSLCTAAAQSYGVTFYQVGICTSDPLINPIPDTTSCFILFDNNAGEYVDIGTSNGNSAVTLALLNSQQRPNNAAYPYIYIIFGNTVAIKGQATVSDGTFYTTNAAYSNNFYSLNSGALASTNPSGYSTYQSATNFLSNNGINAICTDPNNGVGGRISLLTNSGQAISPSGNTCPGAAKIAVSARTSDLFGSTLNVTPEVNGIRMRFSAPEALGLYANIRGNGLDTTNPSSYDYVIDFRGFRLNLTLSD